jgi:hypothetical protein
VIKKQLNGARERMNCFLKTMCVCLDEPSNEQKISEAKVLRFLALLFKQEPFLHFWVGSSSSSSSVPFEFEFDSPFFLV